MPNEPYTEPGQIFKVVINQMAGLDKDAEWSLENQEKRLNSLAVREAGKLVRFLNNANVGIELEELIQPKSTAIHMLNLEIRKIEKQLGDTNELEGDIAAAFETGDLQMYFDGLDNDLIYSKEWKKFWSDYQRKEMEKGKSSEAVKEEISIKQEKILNGYRFRVFQRVIMGESAKESRELDTRWSALRTELKGLKEDSTEKAISRKKEIGEEIEKIKAARKALGNKRKFQISITKVLQTKSRERLEDKESAIRGLEVISRSKDLPQKKSKKTTRRRRRLRLPTFNIPWPSIRMPSLEGLRRAIFGRKKPSPSKTSPSKAAPSKDFLEGVKIESNVPSLIHFLSDPKRAALFEAHLKDEFSQENVNFLNAISELNTLLESGATDKRLAGKVDAIISEYVPDDAPQQVNINGTTKSALVKGDLEKQLVALKGAESEVIAMISRDSFTRLEGKLKDKEKTAEVLKKTPLNKEFSEYMNRWHQSILAKAENNDTSSIFSQTIASRASRVESRSESAPPPIPPSVTQESSTSASPAAGTGRPTAFTPSGGVSSPGSKPKSRVPPKKPKRKSRNR